MSQNTIMGSGVYFSGNNSLNGRNVLLQKLEAIMLAILTGAVGRAPPGLGVLLKVLSQRDGV